jgi:hypothetical protein
MRIKPNVEWPGDAYFNHHAPDRRIWPSRFAGHLVCWGQLTIERTMNYRHLGYAKVAVSQFAEAATATSPCWPASRANSDSAQLSTTRAAA